MQLEALEAMVNAHIKECDARDARNSKSFEATTSMVKGIWDTLDKNRREDSDDKKELRADITKLQMRVAMGLGALIVMGKIADYLLPHVK